VARAGWSRQADDMTLRRRIAAVATAVGCGAVPFTWNVTPAAAREVFSQLKEFEVQYRDFDGQTVTCGVVGQSTLFRPDTSTPFEGLSLTFAHDVSGSGSGCNAFVFVTATYTGASGERRRSAAGGLQQVSLDNDDVVTDYAAAHRILFQDCAFDCLVEFSTRPK
jgi:hypothetical protein